MRHHQVKWAAMAVTVGLIVACVVFALVRM